VFAGAEPLTGKERCSLLQQLFGKRDLLQITPSLLYIVRMSLLCRLLA
jgi:hypothetical protein